VTLYFARQAYDLQLASIVSVWTAFVGRTARTAAQPAGQLCTSIFPGRDPGVHLRIEAPAPTLFRRPLAPTTIMPLAAFLAAQAALPGPTTALLLCVRSVGARRSLRLRAAAPLVAQDVQLFDETAAAPLRLWNCPVVSARVWRPGQTLVLLTGVTFRSVGGAGAIGLTRRSTIDLDPSPLRDADWLRRYAQRSVCLHSVQPEVPSVFAAAAVRGYEAGRERTLFTLAEIDER
jgi:hypothetical protein